MVKLTDSDKKRYDRQMMISGFGEEGQRKLKRSRVFIAGAGGLGSTSSVFLAVAGVGHLKIVDDDRIELSNLNRQILHWNRDIGRAKVDSTKEKLSQINPDVAVEVVKTTMTESNVFDLVEGSNVIVDGMDNFPTRYLLNRVAVEKKILFVHGSIYGLEGRATTIIPGRTACLRCIFPESPPPTRFPVLGATPGVIAVIQATEVIKYLTGIGRLLANRLLIYDGESMKFEEISVRRNPDCPDCSDIQKS
ncbi:MAG: HesA/MoeB/ThiF family protein [Methanocellales archaeon]|nr:HesA/MoeB/ThiF family protein [Methanocellales archaeon]